MERLPGDWLSDDRFGDGWEGHDPAAAWAELFDAWLAEHYPQCTRCGDEILGPASYTFGEPFTDRDGWRMERDTPAPADLPPLPQDGLYEAFQELHRDDWAEVIAQQLGLE